MHFDRTKKEDSPQQQQQSQQQHFQPRHSSQPKTQVPSQHQSEEEIIENVQLDSGEGQGTTSLCYSCHSIIQTFQYSAS